MPVSCYLIHPAGRTGLSEASLLSTLCFKSTMWPSSAWCDCSRCWFPVQPLGMDLQNHNNLRTTEICVEICVALDLRVAIAECPALAGDWCRQGLACAGQLAGFFGFYWTFHIFNCFQYSLLQWHSSACKEHILKCAIWMPQGLHSVPAVH